MGSVRTVVLLDDLESALGSIAQVAQRHRKAHAADTDNPDTILCETISATEEMVVSILIEHARKCSFRVRLHRPGHCDDDE